MVNIDKGGPPLTPEARANLIARVKNLLLSPKTEWERIDAEPATVQGLYVGYVCILAAIPALATLLRYAMSGLVVTGVVSAIVTYVVWLGSVAVVAVIAEALAPQFRRTLSRIDAFKLAAYSATPAMLAGVFMLNWMLAPLTIIGLYGIFLFYLGWQQLAKPRLA